MAHKYTCVCGRVGRVRCAPVRWLCVCRRGINICYQHVNKTNINYSNLRSIADEAGTRLCHGGRLAQRGDGAIPRARARSKHLKACASSEASARGQKCVFRLHELLQTGACGPAKGCCPIHKCGADAAVVCTPPQPRGNDHGGPVQPPCQHGNHVSSTSFKATSAATFRTPA